MRVCKLTTWIFGWRFPLNHWMWERLQTFLNVKTLTALYFARCWGKLGSWEWHQLYYIIYSKTTDDELYKFMRLNSSALGLFQFPLSFLKTHASPYYRKTEQSHTRTPCPASVTVLLCQWKMSHGRWGGQCWATLLPSPLCSLNSASLGISPPLALSLLLSFFSLSPIPFAWHGASGFHRSPRACPHSPRAPSAPGYGMWK